MKLLRLLPLLVLPALFLGATCVTHVDQQGPTGPWVGEVINTGPDPVSYPQVEAGIFDADGLELSYLGAQTCPLSLLPGQEAAFELSYPTDLPHLALPLRAQFNPLVQADPGFGWDTATDGLTARVIEKDPARRYVIAEIANGSPHTYSNVMICAIGRTSDGRVAAVSSAALFPTILHSGEKGRVAILFSSMPDGSLDLFPSGSPQCCSGEVILAPSLFHVTAKKVVEGPQGRELRVVGELDNLSGQALSNVTLQAYVEGEPAFPVWASVGCGDGTVGHGAKGTAAFPLPLQPGDKASVVIAGIQGSEGGDVYPVPVSAVSKTQQGEDYVVSATLSNPTGQLAPDQGRLLQSARLGWHPRRHG